MIKFVKETTSMLFNIEANIKSNKNKNENVSTKDFKRIACLGRGAYAEVFLVQKNETHNFYAMKRMKKRTYNGLTRFVITEKEVQRKIDNRFIIKLHYAFQTFDYLYLISDFCPGGDIRALI
jgi:serine/threonine protein kinase